MRKRQFCEGCGSEDAAGVVTMEVTNRADPKTTITARTCVFCAENSAGLPDLRSDEMNRKLNALWRMLR